MVSTPEQVSVDAEIIYLQVPLLLPKRFLVNEFQQILKKYHSGKRGKRTNERSTALYPVVGHVDIGALQNSLEIYDLRKQNPGLPLWEIGQMSGILLAKTRIRQSDYGIPGEVTAKKNVISNIVSRNYQRALKIIAGTSVGKFPAIR